MPIVNAILGAVVLLFGRSLYWLLVGIVGFLVGMQFAETMFADQQAWVQVLVGIGAGVLGALLAIILQRLAFAIAGFFAGGYLAIRVGELLAAGGDATIWLIVGGIVGAILAALLMDWALIVLSSLVGAGAIVTALQFGPTLALVLYVVLVAVGIFVQSQTMQRRRTTQPTQPPPS